MGYKSVLLRSFPALTHRDFRLFWCGQCISLIGTWTQIVGQSWLVYQLTNSSFLLGIVGMLQFVPLVFFALPAGTLIDRYSKKKILFSVQFLLMINAFVLSYLVWSNVAAYWNIAIIAFILGTLNSIDMPVRQSFIVSLATKEHLMNAISLNSTIFNGARIIGPAIAGIIFGKFGAAACFLINGLSFIPVLVGIWLIETEGINTNSKGKINIKQEIGVAIKYILNTPVIYTVMLMTASVNMIIINSNVTIPVLTKTVIGGDAETYGYLLTAMGFGAFLGGISLAISSYKGLKMRKLMLAFVGISVLVLIISFITNYYGIFVALIVTGFCLTNALSASNSTVQLNSPDNMRGRIMSVYTLTLGISITIGNLYAGSICEAVGVLVAYRINGILGVIIICGIILKYNKKVKSQNQKNNEMVSL